MVASFDEHRFLDNRLLAGLPYEDFTCLAPQLEKVRLHQGETLRAPGEAIQHVYFPTEGVVTLLVTLGDGGTAEAGMVGREGMVGFNTVLECTTAPFRVAIQNPGEALRMRADHFQTVFAQSAALQRMLHRYLDAFLHQVSYTAACNALHTLEQRCCRWLLMTQDRVGPGHFLLTQETLALQLGVHRTSVTEVARKLQADGLIRYSRGKVTVLDRQLLEAAGCECYGRIKEKLDAVTDPISLPSLEVPSFSRFLEQLPAAAYTCDTEGQITAFNRQAVGLWGREPKLYDPLDRY